MARQSSSQVDPGHQTLSPKCVCFSYPPIEAQLRPTLSSVAYLLPNTEGGHTENLESANQIALEVVRRMRRFHRTEGSSGFLNLMTTKDQFSPDEVGAFWAEVETAPSDSEREVVLRASCGGLEVVPRSVTSISWEVLCPRRGPGSYTVTAQAYLRNKRAADSLEGAIQATRQELRQIEDQLERESDPERAETLRTQSVLLIERVEMLRSELGRLETPVGNNKVVPWEVR